MSTRFRTAMRSKVYDDDEEVLDEDQSAPPFNPLDARQNLPTRTYDGTSVPAQFKIVRVTDATLGQKVRDLIFACMCKLPRSPDSSLPTAVYRRTELRNIASVSYATIMVKPQFWLALDSLNTAVGVIGITDNMRGCYVPYLCVHPKYRNRGIGHVLLNVATDSVKKRGHGLVQVSTYDEEVVQFLEAEGFEVCSRVPSPEDPGVSMITLEHYNPR